MVIYMLRKAKLLSENAWLVYLHKSKHENIPCNHWLIIEYTYQSSVCMKYDNLCSKVH
jgi:hypothetical protein